MTAYEFAKERYAALGVDTDAALDARLDKVADNAQNGYDNAAQKGIRQAQLVEVTSAWALSPPCSFRFLPLAIRCC